MSKVSWKDIFAGFESKLTFVKKAVLHTTTLTHCKDRQVLLNLFSTKINLKNLKT